jgi:hypothetical protein
VVRFSTMLKWKIVLSLFMCFIWVSLIAAIFLNLRIAESKNFFTSHGLELWSLVYLINILAWLACPILLVYEYRKRIREAWYTHKLFWYSNLIVNILVVVILYDRYSWTLIVINSLQLGVNLVLVVQLFYTKPRKPASLTE